MNLLNSVSVLINSDRRKVRRFCMESLKHKSANTSPRNFLTLRQNYKDLYSVIGA